MSALGRAFIAALALAAALLPATASAALPAPSLAIDTAFAPPTGVAQDDFTSGVATDLANGTAVDGDRIYTVGEVRGATSNDIGIVARHADGTYDTGFSGDGKLALDITTNERDFGVAIAVLPDHRLRILAGTDVTAGSGTNYRVALVGLMANGDFDTSFGTNGVQLLHAGLAADLPGGMAIAPDGRIAVTGSKEDAAGSNVRDDTFVALRAPDGSPDPTFAPGATDPGVVTLNAAGASLNDRGIDVAFRPGGGVVVLRQVQTATGYVAVLHAFDDTGADDTRFSDDGDLALGYGDTAAQTGAIIAYANRLWVTGSARQGTDTNAFLARLDADGTNLQSRTFDMRGQLISQAQAVVSRGVDLTVLPGVPDTLVVGGSTTPSTTTYWGATAFNGLDGDVTSFATGDVVVPTAGPRGIVGVAPGSGWVSVAGDIQDSTTSDRSFGEARLLVDADKTCDLGLKVVQPLELTILPPAPGTIDVRVTNGGTKTCGGSVSGPPTYALTHGGSPAPFATGPIAPGAAVDLKGISVAPLGPLRRNDTLKLTLTAAGDANPADNTASLQVHFDYCDVSLQRAGGSAFVPSEGSRVFPFDVRNHGTTPCTHVRVRPANGARATGQTGSFSVDPGRSATGDIRAAAVPGGRPGTRRKLSFAVRSAADANAANDVVALAVRVVGVGDSNAAPQPLGRLLTGTATRGRGPLTARRLRVTRVDVSVRRLGRGCHWLASPTGRFTSRRAAKNGGCPRPVWLRAQGTRRWRLAMARRLPAGRYELRSRATIGIGFREARFSRADRNLQRFRVG